MPQIRPVTGTFIALGLFAALSPGLASELAGALSRGTELTPPTGAVELDASRALTLDADLATGSGATLVAPQNELFASATRPAAGPLTTQAEPVPAPPAVPPPTTPPSDEAPASVPPASTPPASTPPASTPPSSAPSGTQIVPTPPPTSAPTSLDGVPVVPTPPGTAGLLGTEVRITNAQEPSPAAKSRVIASRRPAADDKVILGFKEVSVPDTIRFIVESTGKVVMTRLSQIQPTKITLLNDQPISRHEALDLLFKAFRLNNIGVVETEREIIIDLLSEIPKIQDPGIVLGPNDDVMAMQEDGVIVSKIFAVKTAKAESILEQIKEFLPDYATTTVDPNSNQILLQGNVGVAKRVQLLIDALDKPAHVTVETRTFRLAYADAGTISQVILDLFESTRSGAPRAGGGANARAGAAGQNRQQQPRAPGGAGGVEGIGTSEQLRVTTLPQINAVVVSAEPDILTEIQRYIIEYWDIPLSKTSGDLFKVYTLKYADPLIVRDVLQTMLEGGTSGASRGGAGARQGGAGGARAGGGGGGGDGSADAAVANIFKIEAIPDNRQLVVISRTPENFSWLSDVIQQIDQPTRAGLPVLVQLKHANAVEVAEQLNALLSRAGSNATIEDAETGLNLGDQFSQALNEGTSGGGGNLGGGDGAGGAAAGTISFPWQTGGGANEDATPESAIIGKVRIVPIIRQNALSILATPEMQQSVLDIITAMDKPGRQVLISAIIASVELKDEFSYGLRVGRDGIVTPLNDNSIGASLTNENTTDNFIPGFDSSILNINVSAEMVIQALDQKTNAKILQQPKLFVADNTEGVVFIGQDVPVVTGNVVDQIGGSSSTVELRAVGVLLNVRPRITQQRDVSLEVNLTLSNIVPGLLINGNQVFDRRTTQTQVTIRNGQTVVLSGIRVETQSDVKRILPLLGEIPGIGDLLFNSTDKANNVQELLAFVTPIVVDNPEENDFNFNEDARRRLRDLSRPMKELIEDGIGGETFNPVLNPGDIPAVPNDAAPAGPRILLPGGEVSGPGETPVGPVVAPTSPGAVSGAPSSAAPASAPPTPKKDPNAPRPPSPLAPPPPANLPAPPPAPRGNGESGGRGMGR